MGTNKQTNGRKRTNGQIFTQYSGISSHSLRGVWISLLGAVVGNIKLDPLLRARSWSCRSLFWAMTTAIMSCVLSRLFSKVWFLSMSSIFYRAFSCRVCWWIIASELLVDFPVECKKSDWWEGPLRELGLYNILDWYCRYVRTCTYGWKIDPSWRN